MRGGWRETMTERWLEGDDDCAVAGGKRGGWGKRWLCDGRRDTTAARWLGETRWLRSGRRETLAAWGCRETEGDERCAQISDLGSSL